MPSIKGKCRDACWNYKWCLKQQLILYRHYELNSANISKNLNHTSQGAPNTKVLADFGINWDHAIKCAVFVVCVFQWLAFFGLPTGFCLFFLILHRVFRQCCRWTAGWVNHQLHADELVSLLCQIKSGQPFKSEKERMVLPLLSDLSFLLLSGTLSTVKLPSVMSAVYLYFISSCFLSGT